MTALQRKLLIGFTLVGAALLRFCFLGDIEYKYDEQWLFAHGLELAHGGPWPWVGQVSSIDTPAPAMAIWVYGLLAWISRAQTPVGLSAAVAGMGFVAVLVLLLWVERRSPKADREAWLWGWALSSLAFTSIVMQRKMWAPSVLPLFMVGALWGWSARDRAWGACLWGALLGCLGQIHMSGFFLALAWGLWTLGRAPDRRSTRWAWLGLGVLAAAWPIVPWLQELHRLHAASGNVGGWSWSLDEVVQFKFWLFWIAEAAGIEQSYVLGRHAFREWVLQPWVAPFWIACACAGLGAVGLEIKRTVVRLRERKKKKRAGSGGTTPTGDLVRMGLWVFGGLLTLSSAPIHRHHLETVFPLAYVWLALAWLRGAPRYGRRVLAGVVAAMFVTGGAFLIFVHKRGGVPGADYGVAYSQQKGTPQ